MIQGIEPSLNMRIAQRSLDACVLRQEALASNIANVETPGYKRMDVAKDFADRLKTAVQRSGAKSALPAPRLAVDSQARALRADGNTIDLENELLQMNKNQVDHEYLTNLIGSNFKTLKMAITGRSSF
jgi:flagellar basal-body rod protein FlgB